VCAEVYSTGRVNIPGGKSLHDVLTGFARLVPELLEFSSSGGAHAASAADGLDDDVLERGLAEDLPSALGVEREADLAFAPDLFAGWGSAHDPRGLQTSVHALR